MFILWVHKPKAFLALQKASSIWCSLLGPRFFSPWSICPLTEVRKSLRLGRSPDLLAKLMQLMPGNKINAFATRKREEHRRLDHYMDGWPMDFNPSSTVTRLHVPAPASSFVESNKRSIISYGSLYSWPSHSLQLGSKVNSPISSSVTFNNSQFILSYGAEWLILC